VCERLCMSAPSTIMAFVPFLETQKWTPGGHGLLGGGATLLSSHARTSRSATSDTAKASQANLGRQPEQRVSSPPVGTLSTASDVADSPNQNSKPGSARDAAAGRRRSLCLEARAGGR
jgi:hypothetical protein